MRAITVLIALSLSTFTYVTTETLPIGLLVTAYGLVVVIASIPLTRATHRLPRRHLLSALLVVFVLATAVSALAHDYRTLLAARMVTALSQALFWSVVTPAAASLFRPAVRAKALSFLYAGASVGALAGVPAGTWLGQQTSWRTAFFALSAVGLLILITIATLMPNTPAGQSDADHGWAPDAGRYWTLVAYTAVSVTGAFAAFTYISPFLTDVSGLGERAVGPVLFTRGLAGLIGVFVAGYLVGRNGWLTMTGLIGVQALALTGQWLFGAAPIAAIITIAVSGFTLAALSAALGARVLEVAPHGSDMAAAGTSTAFNVGITAGALLGGVLLPATGVRSTALAGAALSLAALVIVLIEPAVATRRAVTRQPATTSQAA